MLDIIAGSRTSEEAVRKVYAAGFRWNDPENEYGRKYRAYKTGTAPDIRSDAVRQFVRGPVVFDIATGNTSFFNKVIGPIRDQITSARGSDIVVKRDQLLEIQAKAAKNSIVFLPQSLADPGKLPSGIEDHSVDTVTIVGALHHMTDEVRDSILREAHRILRPSGQLVVLEDTASAENPMTFAAGTYKEDVRQGLLSDFNRMSRENQKYIFALVDWMGNHLAPGDTSIPLSFNFKTRDEWHGIFTKAGFEVQAEANLGVTPYKFHTHPELIFSLKPVSRDIAEISNNEGVTSSYLMTQISEGLPVHAQIFKTNLERVLAEHPDQLFFMGIESGIGESQKAQIMPIHIAIDEIRNMKGADGRPLFPNLLIKRAKAGELVSAVKELNELGVVDHNGIRFGSLNLEHVFIGARKTSSDSGVFDVIKGENRAWISAIDDSSASDYIPVFEAITLNMMAYLNADLTAIKNFYDAIAAQPIDPGLLQDMLKNRIIYILPKMTEFDEKQLRSLYELAHRVYVAA
jgi:ubiquinone/menaquinone biosynthesis C-methylase UbiE